MRLLKETLNPLSSCERSSGISPSNLLLHRSMPTCEAYLFQKADAHFKLLHERSRDTRMKFSTEDNGLFGTGIDPKNLLLERLRSVNLVEVKNLAEGTRKAG